MQGEDLLNIREAIPKFFSGATRNTLKVKSTRYCQVRRKAVWLIPLLGK